MSVLSLLGSKKIIKLFKEFDRVLKNGRLILDINTKNLKYQTRKGKN